MAITLNQIAEICGVSRGTVDRALHNKGNVRPAVAERIKAVANEYGYIPNRAGLALSRASHPIRIGVIMISVQTPFMQLVLDAARREARRLAAFSVEVIFRLSTSLDPVEQVSMIENLVEQHHISALAITPLDCLLVETKINELIDQRGIPVVTFNTDLPNSRRLCYVGQENLSSGRTVAELLRLVTRESGTVATIITPCMYHSAYRERLKGFKEELLTPDSPLQLQEVTLPNDDSNVVYEHTLRLLQETPELTGIYAITPGYAGACSALVDSGRARGVHLIMHDEIPRQPVRASARCCGFCHRAGCGAAGRTAAVPAGRLHSTQAAAAEGVLPYRYSGAAAAQYRKFALIRVRRYYVCSASGISPYQTNAAMCDSSAG